MKKLIIEISYVNMKDAVMLAKELIRKVEIGTADFHSGHNEKAKGTAKLWGILETDNLPYTVEPTMHEMKPRREIINGKIVDVYQSRMNKN